MISQKYKKRRGTWTWLLIIFIFALWKNSIGFQCDEAYTIALGDMIARGDVMFREIWSSLQMSGIFSAPIFLIYTKIMGSAEGILLCFRIISVCIQAIISMYFYATFIKGGYNRRSVLFASVVFFLFVPDFQTFCYKTELFWGGILEIIYAYRFYLTRKNKYLIYLGVAIAASVLVYPTTIIEFLVYLVIVYLIAKDTEEKQNKIKYYLILILTCTVCAVLFLGFVFSRCSIADFLVYFPKVFQDKNLDTSFLTKLFHPLIKYSVIGCMVLFPIILYLKIERIRNLVDKFHLPIVTGLLWLAFLGQCYIERTGITWHCLIYPYVLCLFLVPVLYFIYPEGIHNKEVIYFFEIPALTITLCIAEASNQGNLVSMFGSVFSVMGLFLLLGDAKNNEKTGFFFGERKWIVGSILIFILCMSIPVWDQETVMPEYEAGSIFTPRVKVTYGPVKGCKMGIPSYEEYNALCTVVEKHVTKDDKLCIIGDSRVSSYGYLYSTGQYATYSPQGGHGVGLNGTIVEYYEKNPQKRPTIVLVNLPYIGQDIKGYLDNTFFGEYLEENEYRAIDSNDIYVVFRK